jgi:hypothetical protein
MGPGCVQDFVDQNFSSKDLKRVIREPSTLDKYLRIPPDMKVHTGACGQAAFLIQACAE